MAGTQLMNDIPTRASAVIIGAGIVGNSLAYHLARLGWTELVLVDKGPMPNPGGSTGHASNFIFPIEYSKMMMELTGDSTEQYQELGVLHHERRDRGGPDRGAHAGAAPALHGRQGLGDTGAADLAGRGGQAGALPRRVRDPRRRVLPDGRRGRLAAGRHADARAGPAARRAAGAGRHRGARHRHRPPTAGSARSGPPRATSRPRSARSAAASGARGSRGWPGPGSRSPRSCTR